MMKDSGCRDWLLQNGGPVVRYLAASEQGRHATVNASSLQNELLGSGPVKYWMKCLTGSAVLNHIHGSRDICFENAMGKLTLYGLRKGMGDLDRRCAPYLGWLRRSLNEKRPTAIFVLHQAIIAAWLAVGGYLSEQPVVDFVLRRLSTIFDFVEEDDFSIYADRAEHKRIPAAFERYPLVDPDLYIDGNFALPWIHDIFAFRALKAYLDDNDVTERIERIICYILDERYQKFHEGYGIVLTGNNQYNVTGWNVWLPCFDGLHASSFKKGCLVQRLELMSHFRTARSSRWFTDNLNMLEEFENESGRYVLSKNYLREKKSSYFVTGGHMGLGENRRRSVALEIESSFWMLGIMKNKVEKDGRE
jgi:hypothetical protein